MWGFHKNLGGGFINYNYKKVQTAMPHKHGSDRSLLLPVKARRLTTIFFLLILVFSGPATAQVITIQKPAPLTATTTPPSVPVMPALLVPSVSPAPSTASVPPLLPIPPQQSAGDDLVLQLSINDAEMQDFVEGLQKDGKTYLPLGQISSLLEFPIVVDANKKTASGWFIREDNKISIAEKTAEVKGQKYDIPPGGMISKDQDLLIDSALLQKWLPLDFAVDLQRMVLNIHPREPLPYQEEQERKKKYAKMEQQQNNNSNNQTAKIQKVDTAYEAAQWPTVDLTFSPAYQNSSPERQAQYSVLAGGDFGYLTTHLYAAGDLEQDRLSDARLSLGRDDYEKNLLGPLHASSFLMGDISAASLSQVTTASQGRGFTMTNRGLDRPDKFGTTSFVGDSKPGWQVELYRNDVLINFVMIDTSGHYEFQDIPVLFGNNVFRLEFYGPQGQRETTTKNINTSDSLLKKGEFTYNVSADQEGQSLLGVSAPTAVVATTTTTPIIAPITTTPTAPVVAPTLPNPTVPRMVGEAEYGVTSWLTATAGGAHTTISGADHDYATQGLHMTFAGMLLGLDNAYDTETNGRSTLGSVTTRLLNTDIQLQQTLARNFVSEADLTDITNPIIDETSLSLIHQFDLPLLGVSDNGLTATRKDYASDRQEELLTYSFSKTFFGMNLTNNLSEDRDNLGLNQVNGILSARGTYGKTQLGLQADYDVAPVKQVDATRLTALTQISDKYSNLATLTNQLSGEKIIQLEDTVTVDMKRYKLSFTGRADDQKNYYIGVTFNISISKIPKTDDYIFSSRPLVDTGTVAIRPFLDMNYNLLYDQGDKPAPDAVIKVGSQTPQKTGDQGLFVATQLPINTPVSISMDPNNQKDPYLAPAAGNYQVVPRAGKVILVDYPLIEVSQIDGTVHVPPGVSPAGLRVDLINTEGLAVSSTHTAFDGYYLLESITPGTYKIRIASDSLAQSTSSNLTTAPPSSDHRISIRWILRWRRSNTSGFFWRVYLFCVST
jgi:hypothetical protein